jgi:apolipoprotein N-acyltransferase
MKRKAGEMPERFARVATGAAPGRPAPGTSHPGGSVPPALTRDELVAARFRLSKVLPYQGASSPFISNLSLAICSGILLVFAFPDWDLWSLAWVGTAPLIMAVVRERRFWRSALLGSITGAVFFFGTSHWITYSMNNYGGIQLWLCFLIGVPLAFALGLFTGVFAGLLALGTRLIGGWGILLAPAIWAATEWARLKATGIGWNALGYSQAFQPAVIQVARFGGVYVVSALLLFSSAALVFALVYLERLRGFVVLTLAGAITAAAILYGQSLKLKTDEQGSVLVGVVQPNVPIAGNWEDPGFVDAMISRHMELAGEVRTSTDSSGVKKDVDLLIWPESSMPMEYDHDPALRLKLAEFAKRSNAYLLFNSWGYPDDSGIRNSAITVAPSGNKIAEYDKIALLPYGEYVPGRNWLPFMGRVSAIVGDLTPGTAVTLSEVAGARVGAFICFEATRPELARDMRLAGASVLVQLSNEAWFGRTAAARQMLAHTVFRAVENNVELIRATNSGGSARIDRYGEVHAVTPMFETATRGWTAKTAEEARQDSETFYTKHGDVFAVAMAACAAVVIAVGFVGTKIASGSRGPSLHSRR